MTEPCREPPTMSSTLPDDQSIYQSALQPVERQLDLIPVILKEAALDSPTFRATVLHFGDQLDLVERWLEAYVRTSSPVATHVNALERLVNDLLSQSVPTPSIGEAVIDHDYTLLAVRGYGESMREFWQGVLRGSRKHESLVVEPIKAFLANDLKGFKETRRALEATQKAFDTILTKYLAQTKVKEASSQREDAFQLHEARKAYIKASMDFCVIAPQVKVSLDKLLVRVSSDHWRDMRSAEEASTLSLAKWASEMDRVCGWAKEMENSERAFKRELLTARRQIEESVNATTRPSRELDDYAVSPLPLLATGSNPVTPNQIPKPSEKQGWLLQKTIVGRSQTRTVWVRRWFFVKNGIFGWLIQGQRSTGVEESEKIGVLLCSIRPASQEERRFCFEIKTKDSSLILQATTQNEVSDWISAFESAKRKALEDPAVGSGESRYPTGIDPAFAVTPPISAEFAAKVGDGPLAEEAGAGDGAIGGTSLDGPTSPLPVARRVLSNERAEGEGGGSNRERIMQKFDIRGRGTVSPSLGSIMTSPSGGIANLISASHSILPVGTSVQSEIGLGLKKPSPSPSSSLAPPTLASPPTPTSLSHAAVILSGERELGLARGSDGSGVPSGVMANLWGSSNWGHVCRLADTHQPQLLSNPILQVSGKSHDDSEIATTDLQSSLAGTGHRHAVSSDGPASARDEVIEDIGAFPKAYPLTLKAQQAQFRILFSSVDPSEKVIMVFRAMWNPTEQQSFPGRVYVTTKAIYFYSNYLGLVLVTAISLGVVNEVTAAPGRDCDFLYLHLKERTKQRAGRLTIKVFLEPLRLLQRRLSYVAHNFQSQIPDGLDRVIETLLKMETQTLQRSSSAESWEDVAFEISKGHRQKDIKASLRIDGTLYNDPSRPGREVQRFKLPAHPVVYAPKNMHSKSVERAFQVSAKALFHVIFGDKSVVFQLLHSNGWAREIVQMPWIVTPESNIWTRTLKTPGPRGPIVLGQSIDIINDHLCYVVTATPNLWWLPYCSRMAPITKIVITHAAKSKCKLAIYEQINWTKPPRLAYLRRLVERISLNHLEADALDLTNVAMDQVSKLGHHSKTNGAIEIFGSIGKQTQPVTLDAAALSRMGGPGVKPRKRLSMLRLIVDDLGTKVLSAFGWLLDVMMALGKGIINMLTTNIFLVALLAFSMLYNSWHTYRDGLQWWHERSAAKFMVRVGVKPSTVMSKAVYLADMDELIKNCSIATLPADTESKCWKTFQQEATLPVPSGSPGRLQKTRTSLAQYRHDLLVALRVLNRVEGDVLGAEWAQWVSEEKRKCKQVEGMLSQIREGFGVEEVGEELAAYCQSCREVA
ncbi:hypothetical protein K470DRAFT_231757, partial [Piedraia hortae CBS 480.64]